MYPEGLGTSGRPSQAQQQVLLTGDPAVRELRIKEHGISPDFHFPAPLRLSTKRAGVDTELIALLLCARLCVGVVLRYTRPYVRAH